MEGLQREGEFGRAAVADGRVDLQRLVDDVAEAGRDVGPQRLDAGDTAVAQRVLYGLAIRTLDGALVGQALVENRRRAPQVNLWSERLAGKRSLGLECGKGRMQPCQPRNALLLLLPSRSNCLRWNREIIWTRRLDFRTSLNS